MRIVPAAVVLLLTVQAVATGDDKPAPAPFDNAPVPYDAAKTAALKKKWADYNKRTISDPYEKIGHRSPRWDAQVREAMPLLFKLYGPNGNADDRFALRAPLKKVIDAGCHDPFLLYTYARTFFDDPNVEHSDLTRRLIEAVKTLEKSKYPSCRRGSAMVQLGNRLSEYDHPDARRDAHRLVDSGLAVLFAGIKEDGTDEPAVARFVDAIGFAYRALRQANLDFDAAYKRIDDAYAKFPEVKLARLIGQADMLKLHGWEFRGTGYANTVTPERLQEFNKYIGRSRDVLESAWKLKPGDGLTAERMLDLQRTLAHDKVKDRESMELWFRRAMEANGDNARACDMKLEWLEPKWFGSFDALLSFGRACRDSKNWESKIPLRYIDAHYRVMSYKGPDDRYLFMKQPSIWKDGKDVFTGYLEKFPNDAQVRSAFAAFCWETEHNDEALVQFNLLGDDLVGTDWYTLDSLKARREQIGWKPKVKGKGKGAGSAPATVKMP